MITRFKSKQVASVVPKRKRKQNQRIARQLVKQLPDRPALLPLPRGRKEKAEFGNRDPTPQQVEFAW